MRIITSGGSRSAMAARADGAPHFGPYEPIRRDYPVEEYLADLYYSGVAGSVYVQTNWAKGVPG